MSKVNSKNRNELTVAMGFVILLCAALLALASIALSATSAFATDFLTTEDGFVFVENESGCDIVAYSGEATEVTVPATLNGKPVTSLVILATSSYAKPSCAEITKVDFSACASTLTSLKIYGTKVQSVDLRTAPNLTYVDVRNNYLTSLYVGENTSLKKLYCSDNLLTSLDVTGVTALGDFRCYNNFITSIDVSKCANLYYLDCHNNNLTGLKVGANTNLYSLFCYSNSIADDLVTLTTNPLCGTTEEGVILPQNGNQYTGGGKVAPEPEPEPEPEPGHVHEWGEATVAFSTDGVTATATWVCALDSSHVATKTCTITPHVTKAATCLSTGETTYVATAALDNETTLVALGSKTVETPATGVHEFSLQGTCPVCGSTCAHVENFAGSGCLVTYSPSVAVAQGCATCNGAAMTWLEGKQQWAVVLDSLPASLDAAFSTDAAATADVIDDTGTEAEKIAKRADLNGNGKINIMDAQIAFDVSNGVYKAASTSSASMMLRSDVNDDQVVNSLDARAIQGHVHANAGE